MRHDATNWTRPTAARSECKRRERWHDIVSSASRTSESITRPLDGARDGAIRGLEEVATGSTPLEMRLPPGATEECRTHGQEQHVEYIKCGRSDTPMLCSLPSTCRTPYTHHIVRTAHSLSTMPMSPVCDTPRPLTPSSRVAQRYARIVDSSARTPLLQPRLQRRAK